MPIFNRTGGSINGGGSLRTLGPVNTTQPVGSPMELNATAPPMQTQPVGQPQPMPPVGQNWLYNFNGPNPPVGNQPADPYAPQYFMAPQPQNLSPTGGPIWSGSPQDRRLQTGLSPQGAYQGGNLGQLGQSRGPGGAMPGPSWWQAPRGR